MVLPNPRIDGYHTTALQRPAVWALYFKNDIDPIPVINTPQWRIMIALNDASTQAVHRWIYKMASGATFFYKNYKIIYH